MTVAFFLKHTGHHAPLPNKIYGDDLKTRCTRIMKTWEERSLLNKNTGVCLVGEKGSGKSLLANATSNAVVDAGGIVVVIDSPVTGSVINELLSKVSRPIAVLFDEYEKVYEETEAQNSLLTFLDGGTVRKVLFLLTVNDRNKMSQFLKNRPGRVFYTFRYHGLDDAFMLSYLRDNLTNPALAEDILKETRPFPEFSFDMLSAVVEEINRYGESPADVLKTLGFETPCPPLYKDRLYYRETDVTSYYEMQSNCRWGGFENPLESRHSHSVEAELYTEEDTTEKAKNYHGEKFYKRAKAAVEKPFPDAELPVSIKGRVGRDSYVGTVNGVMMFRTNDPNLFVGAVMEIDPPTYFSKF